MGIKKRLNSHLSTLRKSLSKKKKLLFIAPVEFHVAHLEEVIKRLKKSSYLEISTLGPFKTVTGHKHYTAPRKLSVFKSFDLVISTDFGVVPYWVDAPKAFFGHGIGPKVNYQGRERIKDFTYSFCPCSAFYDIHNKAGLQCYKIGLPILDNPKIPTRVSLEKQFDLIPELPLLVYAPSWSGTSEVISDIPKILSKLEALEGKVNIVVSPHPNLLDPKRYSEYELFEKTMLAVNRPGGIFNTFSLCNTADYIVSDISSVLFESMALGKTVLFDGNRKIYEFSDAEYILEQMVLEVTTIDWELPLELQLTAAEGFRQPGKFIQAYLYNNGMAGKKMENTINNILNITEYSQ